MSDSAERKRLERERKRQQGLIPVQEWVHHGVADKLRAYAAKLRSGEDLIESKPSKKTSGTTGAKLKDLKTENQQLKEQVKRMNEQFFSELEEQTKERVTKETASFRKRHDEVIEENRQFREDAGRLSKRLDRWMTREEFKLVQSCLHPDKQPEALRGRFDTAFVIFKRLEKYVEADQRINEWAKQERRDKAKT